MNWEPSPNGYELHDLEKERHYLVGVYGEYGSIDVPTADDEWYVWKNGRIISEAMTLEEAKDMAVALYRLGET